MIHTTRKIPRAMAISPAYLFLVKDAAAPTSLPMPLSMMRKIPYTKKVENGLPTSISTGIPRFEPSGPKTNAIPPPTAPKPINT